MNSCGTRPSLSGLRRPGPPSSPPTITARKKLRFDTHNQSNSSQDSFQHSQQLDGQQQRGSESSGLFNNTLTATGAGASDRGGTATGAGRGLSRLGGVGRGMHGQQQPKRNLQSRLDEAGASIFGEDECSRAGFGLLPQRAANNTAAPAGADEGAESDSPPPPLPFSSSLTPTRPYFSFASASPVTVPRPPQWHNTAANNTAAVNPDAHNRQQQQQVNEENEQDPSVIMERGVGRDSASFHDPSHEMSWLGSFYGSTGKGV